MLTSFSNFLLRLCGWTIKGNYPHHLPKVMLVAAPHTSNWDFPLGILLRSAIRGNIRFLAKDSLFRPPFGWFFRWLGGYPVHRDKSYNFVKTMTEIYLWEPYFHTVIAPEGTRKKVDKLKTGFYHIAKGGGAALVLLRLDYGKRETVFSECFYPTDNQAADFQRIDDFFKSAKGKHPELGYLYKG